MTWSRLSRSIIGFHFERVEAFRSHHALGYTADETSVTSLIDVAEKKGEDEYAEFLIDELSELGESKRIAHAAVLLRCASIVEVSMRNAHLRVLRACQARGVLSEGRVNDWKKSFKRLGLKEMVRDLSLFSNENDKRVEANQYPEWNRVNDVRRLCNQFKHAGGVIKYGGGIEPSDDERAILQLTGAELSPEGYLTYHVPYEDLAVGDYIRDLRAYCEKLIDSTEELLDGRRITA